MKSNRTKIVATIGKHNDLKFIKQLYKAGAGIFRLNTAHQTPDETEQIILRIREVSEKAAILIDTKGPEIRTVDIPATLEVKEGEEIFIVPKGTEMSEPHFSVSYNHFCESMNRGTEILIDDGDMSLIVIDMNDDRLRCIANNSGKIQNKKSVNVPDIPIALPSLSKKDEEYIHFAAKIAVDFIAHSFVRNKEDLIAVQKILDKYNSPIRLIAKIENTEGIENINEILDHCHGVMIARGDLGIELPAEEVPLVQKRIIRKCIKRSKISITATQMLHSMIQNPRPTRAEVSDVANAVMDGTDALMLSGETAYGNYALEAVKTMSNIASASEIQRKNKDRRKNQLKFNPVRLQMIASAEETSRKLGAKAIIVQTDTGRSACILSSFRGKTPILALSPNPTVVRQLAMSYGVSPFLLKSQKTLDEMVHESVKTVLDAGIIGNSDMVVLVGSSPNRGSVTNFIEVGEASHFLGGRE
ncbi:pyruvate kinase [Oceanispirochaeta crateris]|uniref:Pyruvate kinase n=1 Tax=Oceanispirochaeta crateris TaxID=2518645 RepID=A0A5C1QN84_9SPIO|nr:pyruvate kinase [Oceanispirochaeta crateris]QEN09141.1 pyruvate kinase [Oceanispirochaeta crateris]